MRLLAFAALTCLATPAAAQLGPMKWMNVSKQAHSGKGRIAVASYAINYVVSQRASARASMGAQSKMEQTLVGVDEATMRRLTDEAYADLKQQLTAAGYAVVPDAETKGILDAGGVAYLPGNFADKKAGGMTFGKKKVSKGYLTVGATAAPLTTMFGEVKAGPFAALAALNSGVGKLYRPAESADAMLIFPTLTVDFADTEARVGTTLAGGRRASIDSEVRFIIRAESKVDTVMPMNKGYAGVALPFFLASDVESDKPFAFGPGERSTASSATNVGGGVTSYQDSVSGPGAVQVDLPKWTALMQEAYRSYNAGIVEALRITKR